jgi:hypothetical protein
MDGSGVSTAMRKISQVRDFKRRCVAGFFLA